MSEKPVGDLFYLPLEELFTRPIEQAVRRAELMAMTEGISIRLARGQKSREGLDDEIENLLARWERLGYSEEIVTELYMQADWEWGELELMQRLVEGFINDHFVVRDDEGKIVVSSRRRNALAAAVKGCTKLADALREFGPGLQHELLFAERCTILRCSAQEHAFLEVLDGLAKRIQDVQVRTVSQTRGQRKQAGTALFVERLEELYDRARSRNTGGRRNFRGFLTTIFNALPREAKHRMVSVSAALATLKERQR